MQVRRTIQGCKSGSYQYVLIMCLKNYILDYTDKKLDYNDRFGFFYCDFMGDFMNRRRR